MCKCEEAQSPAEAGRGRVQRHRAKATPRLPQNCKGDPPPVADPQALCKLFAVAQREEYFLVQNNNALPSLKRGYAFLYLSLFLKPSKTCSIVLRQFTNSD